MAAGVSWYVKRDASAEWSARLRARVDIECQNFANNVLTEAKQNVRQRTGETRDSGQITGGDMVYVVSFGGAALYLEYGTAKQPAYPFLGPAVADNMADFIGRLRMTTQGRVS